MININTLNELNMYGVGADIAKLESYIVDYKQANLTTNMYAYERDYLRMSKILKEIKPDSLAFTDKTSLIEEDTDEYDKLLLKYGNRTVDEIYGTQDENIDELGGYIKSQEDGCIDMVAIPNILGISIRCSYTNGYLYRINIIGDSYKYTDITKEFREQLPKYVEEFSKYKLVELRGKLTIFNNNEELQKISLNVEASTMHLLRLNIDTDKLNIVFDDIFIDSEYIEEYSNQWDKIEFLRSLGFSVPHHALIRNVDYSMIGDAFTSFREYFSNIENTTGIIYKYNGYQIRDNEKMSFEQDYSKFIYIFDKCDYKKIFNARLKSVLNLNDGNVRILLKIVSTKCNDCLNIDTIEVQDINVLNTYELLPGSNVFFFINDGKAILTSNKKI